MDLAVIADAGRWLFMGAMVALALNVVCTYRIPTWAKAGLALRFFAFAGAASLAGATL